MQRVNLAASSVLSIKPQPPTSMPLGSVSQYGTSMPRGSHRRLVKNCVTLIPVVFTIMQHNTYIHSLIYINCVPGSAYQSELTKFFSQESLLLFESTLTPLPPLMVKRCSTQSSSKKASGFLTFLNSGKISKNLVSREKYPSSIAKPVATLVTLLEKEYIICTLSLLNGSLYTSQATLP